MRARNAKPERRAAKRARNARPEVKVTARATVLKRKYGITFDDYNAILAAQGGLCAICGTDKPGGMGAFHVDHDHKTNELRGLLCNNCNIGLGYFHDNTATFHSVIRYLEASSETAVQVIERMKDKLRDQIANSGDC
jgi:hypothetical protein